VLAWFFMLRNFTPGAVLPHWGDILANQVGETLVLFAAAFLLEGAVATGVGAAPRLLALAALVATVADLTSAGARLTSSPAQLVASEVSLALSAALVATAGLWPAGAGRRPGLVSDLLLRTMAHLPHAAILVVSGLLILELPRTGRPGTPVPVLAVALVVLTALAILRLALAQREAEEEAGARAAREERLRQGMKLEAMGQLASQVAHDFANLLTGLQGCVGDLRQRLPEAAELSEIDQIGARGAELCRGLLGFARRVPVGEVADLREVAEGVAPLLRRLLPAGTNLQLDGSYGVARALADPAQIEIALVNLVVNARDAMPAGGSIQVAVDAADLASPARASPGRERTRRWARIQVRDTGTGMDPATLARCREPFFTTKPAGRGTGLGLPTVSGIAEAAGGRLVIESAPGQGTRVALLLRPADDAA